MEKLPSPSDLTSRIATCIGIWETNRGGDRPKPMESSLDTVCGIRASMATIEQATMPYAVNALRQFVSLRGRSNPALTKKELDDADTCCQAVVTLLDLVTKAVAAGMTPEQFAEKRSAQIARTNLTGDDVSIMFKAVALKKRIDAGNASISAKKGTPESEAALISKADRLGLGTGSLTSYLRKPENWGENRAAWQRKAVNAMPHNIGARIMAVAESDGGTAFVIPVVRSRVDMELAKKPVPSLEAIVSAVGRKNNPGEASYGENIWKTYKRLYVK